MFGYRDMNMRALRNLTVDDLTRYPVWEMVDGANSGDVLVKPVRRLPARTLRNRLIGTNLLFADGSTAWALLGNISHSHLAATKHFMTVSVHHTGKWFDLARYHDVDYARRDATALARFLSKEVSDVFPLTYDITSVATGLKEVLSGQVPALPQEQLGPGELISLSLEAE